MRLDVYLQKNGRAKSRTRAKEYIEKGCVKIGGKTVLKCSYEVSDGEEVTVIAPKDEYVGRGAHKLEGALEVFGIDVSGKRCTMFSVM